MRSEPHVLRAVTFAAATVVAAGALTSCAKSGPPGEGVAAAASRSVGTAAPPAAAPKSKLLPQTEVTWTYADTPMGQMNAVVVVPEREADQQFPVLLTFHGTGEARKGPERGARGWIDDYGLYKAIERLHIRRSPPKICKALPTTSGSPS